MHIFVSSNNSQSLPATEKIISYQPQRNSFFVEYEENLEKCVPVAKCCWNVRKINFAFIFACRRRRRFASVNEFFFGEIRKIWFAFGTRRPNAK